MIQHLFGLYLNVYRWFSSYFQLIKVMVILYVFKIMLIISRIILLLQHLVHLLFLCLHMPLSGMINHPYLSLHTQENTQCSLGPDFNVIMATIRQHRTPNVVYQLEFGEKETDHDLNIQSASQYRQHHQVILHQRFYIITRSYLKTGMNEVWM